MCCKELHKPDSISVYSVVTKLHQRINCTAHIIGIFHVSFAKTTAELSLPLIVFRIFLYFSNFSNYLFCLVYLIFFYSYLLSSSTCFSFFVSPFLFLEFFLFFYLFKLFILSRLFILVLLIFFLFSCTCFLFLYSFFYFFPFHPLYLYLQNLSTFHSTVSNTNTWHTPTTQTGPYTTWLLLSPRCVHNPTCLLVGEGYVRSWCEKVGRRVGISWVAVSARSRLAPCEGTLYLLKPHQ